MRLENLYDDKVEQGFQKIQLSMLGIKIPEKPTKGIHSELHLLVADLRKEFGETAKTGPGSFGFYLGHMKRLGIQTARRLLSEVHDSNCRNACRLFWWKYKQEMLRRRVKKDSIANHLR